MVMDTDERLADQLRRTIEAEIVSGQRPPGSRIEEAALAARFGVSRTPVREALMQLASIGFVAVRPHQGAVVARMTVQGMMEMFEVMAELEALSAALAARRMTDPERRALQEVHEACRALVEAAEPERYYDENKRFHERIYAGSHNRFLEQNTKAIRNRVSPYRRLQLRLHGRLRRSWEEHDAVVRAILEGDGEAARRAMQGHVTIQGSNFTDFIASLPPAYLDATGTG